MAGVLCLPANLHTRTSAVAQALSPHRPATDRRQSVDHVETNCPVLDWGRTAHITRKTLDQNDKIYVEHPKELYSIS